jgi:hypothetical protein
MKKPVLLTVILILACITGYLLFFHKEVKPEEKKDQSMAISKNSNAVETSFSELIAAYYLVKDALVDWDSTAADRAVMTLQQRADSLPLTQLKADSGVIQTADNFASSLSSEAKGFKGETTLEQKRRAFNMITDEMYNLLRTVKYSGSMVYHIKCPMAFNDSEEAYWLSNTSKVINPYLGRKHPKYHDKMTDCGEVVDSIDFVKK